MQRVLNIHIFLIVSKSFADAAFFKIFALVYQCENGIKSECNGIPLICWRGFLSVGWFRVTSLLLQVWKRTRMKKEDLPASGREHLTLRVACAQTTSLSFITSLQRTKHSKALENSAEVVTYRKTFYGWGYNKFILRLSGCVVVGLYRCVVVYLCPCLFVRLCGCRVYWLSGCRLCCMVAW